MSKALHEVKRTFYRDTVCMDIHLKCVCVCVCLHDRNVPAALVRGMQAVKRLSNWLCQLTHVDLYNGCKVVVAVVDILMFEMYELHEYILLTPFILHPVCITLQFTEYY